MADRDPHAHEDASRLRAQLRETFAHMGEGVCIFDAGYRLVAISACAIELTGLRADQLVPGVHYRDLLLQQAMRGEFGPCEPVAEADLRMQRLQALTSETREHRRPDGSVLEVRRSALPDGGFLMILLDVTAQRRAQRELSAFKFVVDSITDMVSVMDPGMRYLVVNDEWCRATGTTRARVLGRTPYELWPVAISEERRQAFQRCLATRQPQMASTVLELAGRGMREIETTYHPYVDDNQELQGVVLVSRDWTERRLQERRKREHERFIATVADNVPGMVAYWTRDLHCAFANTRYHNWFGHSAESIKGIALRDLVNNELFASAEPHIRAVLRGEDQKFERVYTHADGTQGCSWVQYIADRMGEEVCGYFVLISDITALKKNQLDLEKTNAALRVSAIAFEAQEGIMVTDVRRKVLQVNSAFVRMTGYAAADLVGHTARRLRSSRYDQAYFNTIFDDVQASGQWEGELWCRHALGHEFPVSITVASVRDAGGHITHYVRTYVDVTDRHRRDEQRRADEAAQRAALVRELHHRIKNNLQGITGLLQRFGRDNPQTAGVMNQAIGQVKSIATVHGLQGKQDAARLLLHELVAAIAAQVRDIWQVPVRLDVGIGATGFAIAEEEMGPLALILNELLLNAVKHGDVLRPGVDLTLQPDGSGLGVQIRLTNHGSLLPQTPRQALAGAGRQLVNSLMPSSGACLSVWQQDEQVMTLLALCAPVISH